MYVNFEFAALLPSPYIRVKKCAKFKTNIHLVSVDSFLALKRQFFKPFLTASDKSECFATARDALVRCCFKKHHKCFELKKKKLYFFEFQSYIIIIFIMYLSLIAGRYIGSVLGSWRPSIRSHDIPHFYSVFGFIDSNWTNSGFHICCF